MATNGQNHSPYDIFTIQPGLQTNTQMPRDVRQDKYAPERGESTSAQSVPLTSPTRTPSLPPTGKRHGSHKRRTKQVAGWVPPHIKEEIQRLAKLKGWSESKTVATLLDGALQRKLGEEYATILSATIEHTILKANRALATRFAFLLVRIAFDAGQTRVLATNTLGRQEGMTEDTLKEILATADRRTKANLTRKSPQLSELVHTVEEWLLARDTEDKEGAS